MPMPNFNNVFGAQSRPLPRISLTLLFLFLTMTISVGIGYAQGLDGELTWSGFGEALGGFFGGTQSLLALIGLLVVICGGLYGVYRLSEAGHHVLVAVSALASFIAGLALSNQIKWSEIEFGFWPMAITVIVLAILATIHRALDEYIY